MKPVRAQVTGRVLKRGKNRIIALLSPSHTIILFQDLDLSVSHVLKTVKRPTGRELDHDSANSQLTKFIHAHEQTATAFPSSGLFIKAGLVLDTPPKPENLSITKEILVENSTVSKIGNLNGNTDQLSQGQHSPQF
jgi:hypothetical protein